MPDGYLLSVVLAAVLTSMICAVLVAFAFWILFHKWEKMLHDIDRRSRAIDVGVDNIKPDLTHLKIGVGRLIKRS